MEGYFKMFRSYVNNKIWRDDPTAWHIFEYFLAKCDYSTGKWTIDYLTMSEYLGIPKSTLHKAIKRLKKAEMVNDTVNDKNTTFEIINWNKHQFGEQDGERKVNAKETKSEHIKEIKKTRNQEIYKKEINKEKSFSSLEDLTDEVCQLVADDKNISLSDAKEVRENIKLYCEAHGKRYKNYKSVLISWILNDIKKSKITKIQVKKVEPVFTVTPEQRRVNLEKLAEVRKDLLVKKII